MLLHFVQKSPGDYVPQEQILQALGIASEGGASGQGPPQVSGALELRAWIWGPVWHWQVLFPSPVCSAGSLVACSVMRTRVPAEGLCFPF